MDGTREEKNKLKFHILQSRHIYFIPRPVVLPFTFYIVKKEAQNTKTTTTYIPRNQKNIKMFCVVSSIFIVLQFMKIITLWYIYI